MGDPIEISKRTKMQHSILSEEGTLKYDFMTSLQKIAMARIMSHLWMNQKTKKEILNLYQRRKHVYWNNLCEVEEHIVAKVSQLLLPNSICQELTYLVSVFGNLILKWILYHNETILIPKQSGYSAIDFIHNITWTTRGKIDYVQTAKNILHNKDNCLSDDHKCKLACTFCLENEIIHLSSGLINRSYLSSIMIDRHPMVYFWAVHITGDRSLLNNPLYCSDSNRRHFRRNIYNHIMQLLVKCGNAVSLKFMWTKLNHEEKSQIIVFLFKHVNNSDFILSILSDLDYDQQQNILKNCSETVLCAIVNEYWWWGKYFIPTTLNVLDFMNSSSFWRVLNVINERKRMSSPKKISDCYKSLFKYLWQESSMQLKTFVIPDPKWQSPEQILINNLNWEQDMDLIEVIFKDLNAQQKKYIALNRKHGIHKCAEFIYSCKWNVLDLYIKYTLSSEEDIGQLKQRVVQYRGEDIAVSFLMNRKFHEMERFMNWAFNSVEEIASFCQNLNYTMPLLTQ